MGTAWPRFERRNTLDGSEVEGSRGPAGFPRRDGTAVVGFIKVDVEGHELDVLRGAEATLRRDRPALLVESEERHRPGAVAAVHGFLGSLGYHGFMVDDGRLVSLGGFDPSRDQNVPNDRLMDLNAGHYEGRYVNNFFFVA